MERIKNFIRNINYLTKYSLWEQREEDIVYLTNKILDDGIYEYGLEIEGFEGITILDDEESFQLVVEGRKSFVRTGDGEIKIMMGMDQPFQKYDKEIAERLCRLFSEPDEKIYVGLNRNYFLPMRDNPPKYYRRNAYDFRQFYSKYCLKNKKYISSVFTGHNWGEEKSEKVKHRYQKWLEAFENEDIVIVCGEGILNKLEYDIFERAKSKKIIEGPRCHAWDKHTEIMNQIEREVSKEQLIVFILGMAGKAMIPELVDRGYTCWDVGHLAKYYNAYMTGMENNSENIANFFAPD